MENYILFKTARQLQEWESGKLNPKIKIITEWFGMTAYKLFNKKITITDIFRSQEENDEIYGEPGHVTVHSFFRGIDIRASDFTSDEKIILVGMTNCIQYDKKRPEIKSCVYGDERHINHLHIQSMPS